MEKGEKAEQARFDMALEELKLLQSIIQHQEDLATKIRGGTITLITLLSVAQASDEFSPGVGVFLLVGLTLVATSWVLEIWYRMSLEDAGMRSSRVEAFLRHSLHADPIWAKYAGPPYADDPTQRTWKPEDKPQVHSYDGPLIGISMTEGDGTGALRAFRRALRSTPRTLIAHSFMAIIVVGVALATC